MIRDRTGSVTIWVLLILGSVLSLLLLVMAGIRIKIQKVTASHIVTQAVDADMADYCRELFEDYGVMFCLEDQTEAEILSRLQQTDDLQKVSLEDCQVKKTYALDFGAGAFRQQVCSYMEAVVPAQVITKLISDSQSVRRSEQTEEETVSEETEDQMDELSQMAEGIYEDLKKLKEAENKPRRRLLDLIRELQEAEAAKGKSDWAKESYEISWRWQHLIIDVVAQKQALGRLLARMEAYEAAEELLAQKESILSGKTEEADFILENKRLLEQVQTGDQELQEYLQKHKPEEEADVSEALEKLEQFQNIYQDWDRIALPAKKGSEDKDLLGQLKALLTEGKLALVAENVSELSNAAVEFGQLPSERLADGEEITDSTVYQKALCSQYLAEFFGNYREAKPNTALRYELEYVLGGKERDKENLSEAVTQLIRVREGINLISLLADSQKMAEAGELAAVIVGWSGIPVLQMIVKGVIVAVWSFAESVMDVKSLMAGNQLGLIKSKDDWQLSLDHVLEVSAQKPETSKEQKGMTYEQYLQCLLLLQDDEILWGRTMDLIQFNLQTRYNRSFSFYQCIDTFQVSAEFRIQDPFNLADSFSVSHTQSYTRR